jgi:hypothetical protein
MKRLALLHMLLLPLAGLLQDVESAHASHAAVSSADACPAERAPAAADSCEPWSLEAASFER